MADDERTANAATILLEKPETLATAPVPAKKSKKNKNQKDIDEYEVEFETPFGKLEFEFEPKSTKERKDAEKRARKEADEAKAAEKARKNAEKEAVKLEKKGLVAAAAALPEPKRGGSNLIPILLIFALIATAIAVAIWLFARPGDEDLDQVPKEFLNDAPTDEPAPQPQGFVAKAQARVRDAIRAGKQASRETQAEQQKKFEDLTGSR